MRHLLSVTIATLFWVSGQCLGAAAPYLGVAPQGDPQAGAHFATATCAACHGAHGNSLTDGFPNLAGQNYNYLLKQLEDFRSGVRKAPPMNAMIATVPKAPGDQNLKDIAAYYAAQPLNRKVNANARAPKIAERQGELGYKVYQQGLPDAHVPACAACHTASGTGMAPMAVPALAGQHAAYVEKELKFFAGGQRDNSPGHVMATIARRLTPTQIEDVALYAQALRPGLTAGVGAKSYQAYVKALADQPVPGVPASAVASGAAKSAAK